MYAATLQQPAGRSYEIIRQLAVGGMGVVSLARDSAGKLVVLKRPIGRSPSDKKRLVDEATIGLRLVHPAIVRTIELFRDQDQPVLVLEYVQGLTLAESRSRATILFPMHNWALIFVWSTRSVVRPQTAHPREHAPARESTRQVAGARAPARESTDTTCGVAGRCPWTKRESRPNNGAEKR